MKKNYIWQFPCEKIYKKTFSITSKVGSICTGFVDDMKILQEIVEKIIETLIILFKNLKGLGSDKEQEYWKNVSPQWNLPLAGEDKDYPLAELKKLCKKIKSIDDGVKQKKLIIDQIVKTPKLLNILRLFIYKTETRLELDLSFILRNTKDSKNESLCGCSDYNYNHHKMTSIFIMLKNSSQKLVKKAISDYLFSKGLSEFLKTFSSLTEEEQNNSMNSMIESDSRQSEAKRRGHGAERELARVIIELGCKLLPPDKLKNEMAGDVRLDIDTFQVNQTQRADNTNSYDLVVLDSNDKVKVVIIGLIHTSNPGQYGKDKICKTSTYRKEVTAYNSKKQKDVSLCALVDGTGFSMSKQNLKTLIDNVDDIFQINTTYKIGLLLHKKGLCKIKAIKLDCKFYNQDERNKIKAKYIPSDIKIIQDENELGSKYNSVKAGKGILYF